MLATPPERLVLSEHRTSRGIPLDAWQVAALRRAVPDIAIAPANDKTGSFDLTPGSHVGTLELDGWPIEILPKVPVDRVLFLVSYGLDAASWDHAAVDYDSATSLVDAVGRLFGRLVERALGPGVLHGYRPMEDALHTVRGSIRFGDQVRHRYGRNLPLEVSFDEFTEDIPENRILKVALWRLGRFPLSEATRNPLRRYESLLGRVRLHPATDAVAEVTWSRLNERYRPAVALARIIAKGGSIDVGDAHHRADGFIINMNRVFEDFVVGGLRAAMGHGPNQLVQGAAGRTLRLDAASLVGLEPDLSWWNGSACVLIGDAKYKRLSAKGIKHPDLYQLVAYLVATGLRTGVLVYPKTEAQRVDHDVPGLGARLLVRSIDLAGQPDDILAAVRVLASELHLVLSTVEVQPNTPAAMAGS